ncbi:MAG: D-lactate dehydrogenase, partial [Bacteroidota bacterium]
MTEVIDKVVDEERVISQLKKIAGAGYVLTGGASKQPYSKGFRYGSGEALAVVRPGTLLETWKVLQICASLDAIVIMQATNTGLTGGSTPNSNNYDRPVVVVNTMRITGIHLIDEGAQIVGLAGSTLFDLENKLKAYDREPHSVIGSTSIGASIIGGICNNSGGSLIKRGPAYTELSLYAQVNKEGELVLVNELGIDLGNTPEDILTNLQDENYSKDQIQYPDKLASDNEYEQRVRDINADTPARFNADSRRLYGASGSAGKVAVFAVRLDTYPAAKRNKVFYVGTNDPNVLWQIRRDILSKFKHLPTTGDY